MTNKEKYEERINCIERIYYLILEQKYYIIMHHNKYSPGDMCFLLVNNNLPIKKETIRFPL